MRKWAIIIGSAAMIILFVAIMGSGLFLKEPLTKNDDVMERLELVEKSIDHKEWDKAEGQLTEGFKAWSKIKNRIQFSVEREFIVHMEHEFGTLRGAIKAQDEDNSIISIENMREIWENLGK